MKITTLQFIFFIFLFFCSYSFEDSVGSTTFSFQQTSGSNANWNPTSGTNIETSVSLGGTNPTTSNIITFNNFGLSIPRKIYSFFFNFFSYFLILKSFLLFLENSIINGIEVIFTRCAIYSVSISDVILILNVNGLGNSPTNHANQVSTPTGTGPSCTPSINSPYGGYKIEVFLFF